MKNLTWQNPEQLFVAQELINKVKSKCCGIKVFETSCKETAQYANPKEHLHYLINRIDGKKKNNYIDTDKKNLNYIYIAKDMRKKLKQCRQKNRSLDLFCLEIEDKVTE